MRYEGTDSTGKYGYILCTCGTTIRVRTQDYRVTCPDCRATAVIKELMEGQSGKQNSVHH